MPGQDALVVFWESLGYHNHGDPWREERYWGD
jgi:DMSO/TMAO reductase YedYZ molybdopterin-dependent catalytic subunit